MREREHVSKWASEHETLRRMILQGIPDRVGFARWGFSFWTGYACGKSARGTLTCSVVPSFFNAKASAFTSFSPTMIAYRAPSLSPSPRTFLAGTFRRPARPPGHDAAVRGRAGRLRCSFLRPAERCKRRASHDMVRALGARHHQAIFADGEADARARRSAEHFRQAVVASAAKDRVLRAERAMRELERGASVVIQSAHQAIVEFEGDADGVEDPLNLVEVLAAGFVEDTG